MLVIVISVFTKPPRLLICAPLRSAKKVREQPEIRRACEKMIEEEDSAKPLTDDHIAQKLEDAGIHVTRRTVAKYREDMRIPSTHQRRVKS